jgi:outer membrane protein assembly factor BamB
VLAPANPAQWTTYHHDAARTGVDPSSPAAANVHRQWTSDTLDGLIYGEPLAFSDTVIAATENDTVYALDSTTGKTRWAQHLGAPISGDALQCGNINPSGITSTPVIDAPVQTGSGGLVWVVAFVQPGRHELVGIDLGTGGIRSRRSVDPPGADPMVQQQRSALTLSAGRVYIPFGGLYGDCGNYRGYVVSLPETDAGPLQSWVVPTARRGGIWAPPGAVVDAGGRLFVSTGNTASTGAFDDANAVVRLSPDLHQEDVFAPVNWASLSATDTDLGSVAPTLLPGGMVFQVGKEGVGYLLNGDHLGGVGGQMYSAQVCGGPAYGGTAVVGSSVYVPCRDGLVDVEVSGPRFAVGWRTASFPAGSPVVAGGEVWVVSVIGTLYGFDPRTGAERYRDQVGEEVTHFPFLAAGGGELFIPTGNHLVAYTGV